MAVYQYWMKTSDFDSRKKYIFAMVIVEKFAITRNANIAVRAATCATAPAAQMTTCLNSLVVHDKICDCMYLTFVWH